MFGGRKAFRTKWNHAKPRLGASWARRCRLHSLWWLHPVGAAGNGMNREGVEQMAHEAGMLAGVWTRYHHTLVRVYCSRRNSCHEQGVCEAG
jgi:hypothetical protein